MQRLLVIAADKSSAAKAEELIGTGVEIKKVYPGVTSFPDHFDAVVLYYNDFEDFKKYEEERKRYQNAPIRVLFGPE